MSMIHGDRPIDPVPEPQHTQKITKHAEQKEVDNKTRQVLQKVMTKNTEETAPETLKHKITKQPEQNEVVKRGQAKNPEQIEEKAFPNPNILRNESSNVQEFMVQMKQIESSIEKLESLIPKKLWDESRSWALNGPENPHMMGQMMSKVVNRLKNSNNIPDAVVEKFIDYIIKNIEVLKRSKEDTGLSSGDGKEAADAVIIQLETAKQTIKHIQEDHTKLQ